MTTPEPATETDRSVAGRVLPDTSGTTDPRDPSTVPIPDPIPELTGGPTAASRPPIVCDMTDAPDARPERLAEYARLFETAYLGRDRDHTGARWLLSADPGVEEWARDLADRENACCAFMTNTVTREGDLVIWHATTIDDEDARAVLSLFHELPMHRPSSVPDVEDAVDGWSTTGFPIIVREGDVTRQATAEEIREGRG